MEQLQLSYKSVDALNIDCNQNQNPCVNSVPDWFV